MVSSVARIGNMPSTKGVTSTDLMLVRVLAPCFSLWQDLARDGFPLTTKLGILTGLPQNSNTT